MPHQRIVERLTAMGRSNPASAFPFNLDRLRASEAPLATLGATACGEHAATSSRPKRRRPKISQQRFAIGLRHVFPGQNDHDHGFDKRWFMAGRWMTPSRRILPKNSLTIEPIVTRPNHNESVRRREHWQGIYARCGQVGVGIARRW